VENSGTGEGLYIVLSAELNRLLSENSVSLTDILAKGHFSAADASIVSNPAASQQGVKEVATIILASAAAVAALTPLITRVVRLYTQRPIVVEDTELVPIYHEDGRPVFRSSGELLLQWQRKKRLLQPRQDDSVQTAATVKGYGIEFTVG
jgi:hypothetical protein